MGKGAGESADPVTQRARNVLPQVVSGQKRELESIDQFHGPAISTLPSLVAKVRFLGPARSAFHSLDAAPDRLRASSSDSADWRSSDYGSRSERELPHCSRMRVPLTVQTSKTTGASALRCFPSFGLHPR